MPRSGRHRPFSIFILAAEWALWAIAFFCPLALGSSPTWTLWPLCALAGAGAIAAAVGSARSARVLALPPFGLALGAAATLCVLQLIPLPRPLLDWLSPASAQIRDFALIPLGLRGPRPISLDPPATWRELAKAIAYGLIFFTALQVSRSRSGGRRRLLSAIALSGVAVALVGYGHALADAHSLFGIYSYEVTPPPFLTTFGNPNHLASFLTLTSTLALGLALTAADRQRASLWGLAFVASGAAVFLSLSRGGICFFVAAQLIFLFLLFRNRRGRASASSVRRLLRGRESWVILGALAVLSVSGFVASERIIAELQTADSVQKLRESKIQMWPMLIESARRVSRAGMGRGAFEAAFPRYQTESPEVTFTHAENIVLQLLTELGVVGAALLVGLTVWAFLRLLQRQSSPLDIAILSGLAAMVLHDFFDFSLELPGCAAVACLGIGVASRSDDAILAEKAKLRASPSLVAVVAALALVALAALAKGRHTLGTAERGLAAILAKAPSAAEIISAAARFIDRHPADYLLYDLAGGALNRAKPGQPNDALAFANRALFLRPLDVEAHRVAARSLLKLGRRGQAMLEYRLAYEAGQDQGATLDEAVPAARAPEEWQLLVPHSPVPISEVAERLWSSGRKPQAEAFVESALSDLSSHPDVPELWLLEARYRSARRDFSGALQAATQGEKIWPNSSRPVLVKAATLWEMGQTAEAIALLDGFFARHPNELELSFSLAHLLTRAKNPKRAREVLARASPLVSSPASRSRWLLSEGESFESEGQYARALHSYQAAARTLPTQAENHYRVARMLEALKRPSEAMDAVREAMKYEDAAGIERDKVRLAELEEARRKLDALRDEKLLAPGRGE